MVRLGYDRYGAQGGDWGSAVTTDIGRNVGHCVGIHTNFPIGTPPADATKNPTDEEKAALAALAHYRNVDSGYFKQQATRPQTLGYGLVDSPVAQLAWIVEKFWSWTDCDGHPENALGRDEMLDDVMLYWLTASGASSARLYWERNVERGIGWPSRATDGGGGVPQGDHLPAARVVRTELQHHPLDHHAARRPLRGVRTTRTMGRRRAGVLRHRPLKRSAQRFSHQIRLDSAVANVHHSG